MTEELPITDEADVPEEVVPAGKNGVDLSAEIARTIGKMPGDRVRVTQVWADHYRCNWIAPVPQMSAGSKSRIAVSSLDTYHVRQSRFLRVTRQADGKLDVTDLTLDRIRSN